MTTLKPAKRKTRTPRELFEVVTLKVAYRISGASAMCDKMEDDDDRLLHLWHLQEQINSSAILIVNGVSDQRKEAWHELRGQLEKMAAFTLCWRQELSGEFGNDFALVWAERERQRRLRREQPEKYLVALEHPTPDVRRKCRVLCEEIGEVAEGIDLVERDTRHERKNAEYELQKEIMQVSACAFAWLEALEGDSTGANRGNGGGR